MVEAAVLIVLPREGLNDSDSADAFLNTRVDVGKPLPDSAVERADALLEPERQHKQDGQRNERYSG